VYRALVGKPEGKRPLERPRHRWKDGIRMYLRETGWGSVEWIHLAQDRLCIFQVSFAWSPRLVFDFVRGTRHKIFENPCLIHVLEAQMVWGCITCWCEPLVHKQAA
jgi:hypothetical protein